MADVHDRHVAGVFVFGARLKCQPVASTNSPLMSGCNVQQPFESFREDRCTIGDEAYARNLLTRLPRAPQAEARFVTPIQYSAIGLPGDPAAPDMGTGI